MDNNTHDREFRVKEIKHKNKGSGCGTAWVPQYKIDGGRWQNCLDDNGKPIYRDDFSSARHWLFWESGARLYPESGDGDPKHNVKCYDINGNRVKSGDEEYAEKAHAERIKKDWKFIVCECGDVSHQLIIQTTETGEAIVSIHLTSFPFWKRLVNGIKYIFGVKSKYGDFEEVILNKSHVYNLKDLISVLEK